VSTGHGQSVLVLGATLSGLAAAYHLRTHGYAVTLLDYGFWRQDARLQPSQPPIHLLGCHRESWDLLRALSIGAGAHADSEVTLEFRLPDGRITGYRRSPLPKPFHWIFGLLRFNGLSWHDRWNFLSHLEQIWEGAIPAPSDLDSHIADDWLAAIGQREQAREEIWGPVAQWLTGNSLARLSAAQFVQAISRLFLTQPSSSRVSQLEGTGEDRFIVPLKTALLQLGTDVRHQTELPRLQFENARVTGVVVQHAVPLQADWYLAAVPHRQLVALIPERLLTRFAYFSQIGELADLAGLTIQITCRQPVGTPRLLLLARRPFSQLTLTPSRSHSTNVCVTAVGNPSLDELNETELGIIGTAEVRASLPDFSEEAIESIAVSRDDHAALSLHPGVAVMRPIQQSPIQNLLVAGAWTDTGWPASIESALVSARRCVDIIRGEAR
jgi:uncharacterized protein with NAD-binding domain and iron-sulfur cluster